MDFHMMSKDSGDYVAGLKQMEFEPNLFGYWKHLFLELSSANGDDLLPLEALNTESSAGRACMEVGHHDKIRDRKVNGLRSSISHFSEPMCIGISELGKERLNLILNQSIVSLTEQTDEILSQILAAFQIEADLREKELLGCYSKESGEELNEPCGTKKRKAPSSPTPSYSDLPTPQTTQQVYGAIQALQGNGEVDHAAVEMYLNKISTKLDKMEENLEEFLNVVVSKCRQMTHAEKQRLGQLIRKLPGKAIDRVVEIIDGRNPSRSCSDRIHVNLEEQDNVTLWRLYCYVEAVVKASKL